METELEYAIVASHNHWSYIDGRFFEIAAALSPDTTLRELCDRFLVSRGISPEDYEEYRDLRPLDSITIKICTK